MLILSNLPGFHQQELLSKDQANETKPQGVRHAESVGCFEQVFQDYSVNDIQNALAAARDSLTPDSVLLGREYEEVNEGESGSLATAATTRLQARQAWRELRVQCEKTLSEIESQFSEVMKDIDIARKRISETQLLVANNNDTGGVSSTTTDESSSVSLGKGNTLSNDLMEIRELMRDCEILKVWCLHSELLRNKIEFDSSYWSSPLALRASAQHVFDKMGHLNEFVSIQCLSIIHSPFTSPESLIEVFIFKCLTETSLCQADILAELLSIRSGVWSHHLENNDSFSSASEHRDRLLVLLQSLIKREPSSTLLNSIYRQLLEQKEQQLAPREHVDCQLLKRLVALHFNSHATLHFLQLLGDSSYLASRVHEVQEFIRIRNLKSVNVQTIQTSIDRIHSDEFQTLLHQHNQQLLTLFASNLPKDQQLVTSIVHSLPPTVENSARILRTLKLASIIVTKWTRRTSQQKEEDDVSTVPHPLVKSLLKSFSSSRGVFVDFDLLGAAIDCMSQQVSQITTPGMETSLRYLRQFLKYNENEIPAVSIEPALRACASLFLERQTKSIVSEFIESGLITSTTPQNFGSFLRLLFNKIVLLAKDMGHLTYLMKACPIASLNSSMTTCPAVIDSEYLSWIADEIGTHLFKRVTTSLVTLCQHQVSKFVRAKVELTQFDNSSCPELHFMEADLLKLLYTSSGVVMTFHFLRQCFERSPSVCLASWRVVCSESCVSEEDIRGTFALLSSVPAVEISEVELLQLYLSVVLGYTDYDESGRRMEKDYSERVFVSYLTDLSSKYLRDININDIVKSEQEEADMQLVFLSDMDNTTTTTLSSTAAQLLFVYCPLLIHSFENNFRPLLLSFRGDWEYAVRVAAVETYFLPLCSHMLAILTTGDSRVGRMLKQFRSQIVFDLSVCEQSLRGQPVSSIHQQHHAELSLGNTIKTLKMALFENDVVLLNSCEVHARDALLEYSHQPDFQETQFSKAQLSTKDTNARLFDPLPIRRFQPVSTMNTAPGYASSYANKTNYVGGLNQRQSVESSTSASRIPTAKIQEGISRLFKASFFQIT